MTLPRLDRNTTILLALLVAILLADVWYGQDTWRAREAAQGLEDAVATDRQSLRRLQSIAQLSAIQKELADIEAKAPAGLKQPLPASADTLKVISDLLNTQSSGGKITNFKAKDPKTETIDGTPVQVLGYELIVQGNAGELLAMLRRIDESSLVSLKVQTFSIERQQDLWSMKLDVALNLLAAAPPAATPTSKKP